MDHPDQTDASCEPMSNARRRVLLRGGLRAAPIALTVVSGTAFGAAASSTRCLTGQTTNPFAPGLDPDAYVSVPLSAFSSGGGTAVLVSGADLDMIATSLHTSLSYTGTNGGVLTGSSQFIVVTASGFPAGSPFAAGAVVDSGVVTSAPAPNGQNAVVRFDGGGNVIGFFSTGYDAGATAGGTALTTSCQNSFANRPPISL